MKLELSQQINEKYPNIKFHENPSIGSRVVPCGQTDGQAKLTVGFRNSAVAPKNLYSANGVCMCVFFTDLRANNDCFPVPDRYL